MQNDRRCFLRAADDLFFSRRFMQIINTGVRIRQHTCFSIISAQNEHLTGHKACIKQRRARKGVFLLLGVQADMIRQQIINLAILHVKLPWQRRVDNFTEGAQVQKLLPSCKAIHLFRIKPCESEPVRPAVWREPVNKAAEHGLSSAALRHNDDWADAALHNGMRQEYNLSLQGGNAKTTHFLSLGYLKDEGILRHTDFERISARANINHTVNKFIDINGNLAYARAEKNAGQSQNASLSNYSNAFMFTQQIAPIYPVYAYDENGNRIYDEEGNTVYDFGDGTYSTRMGGFSNQNVAANSGLDVHQTLNDNFNGRGTININIIDGLKATANIGYDLMNQIRTDHMNQLYGDAANVNGRTYKYNQRIESFTANQLLTYSKAFGHHNIDIMAGHESYSYTLKYQYTHKYNFYTIGNPEFNNAITMSDMNSYTQEHSMESFFGRVNYDFDNKYYLSASIRSDESSKFHPDHRRGTFWSVGGSWRLTQEEFLKDVEWLSNLKLKASYGTQGNDGILDINGYVVYQPYLKQYSVTNNNGDFSVVETYRGNKDLTWEKSKNLNIGLEAAFLNNRLKLETEYFLKKTSDMLYNMPYPISSGISYVPMNLLDMQNKGIEFTISATPIQTKDFIWNLSFNGTHYSNKILNLPEDKRENGIIHGTASLFRLMEGGSIYDLYTYEYAGVNPETGAAQWYMDEKDANGKVTGRTVTEDYTQASKYELGSTLPDFQGGFSTDFAYKGIDLSIATNFQIGGKIYDSMYSSFMHAGSNIGSNWHKDILNAWTPENKNTNVPIMDGAQNSNSQSSRFLINASFFNIRNISLGYTFPKEWMKAISASSARIYVSADNVALFSKRKGMDPRQYAYGYSAANYSAIRTLSFRVQRGAGPCALHRERPQTDLPKHRGIPRQRRQQGRFQPHLPHVRTHRPPCPCHRQGKRGRFRRAQHGHRGRTGQIHPVCGQRRLPCSGRHGHAH